MFKRGRMIRCSPKQLSIPNAMRMRVNTQKSSQRQDARSVENESGVAAAEIGKKNRRDFSLLSLEPRFPSADERTRWQSNLLPFFQIVTKWDRQGIHRLRIEIEKPCRTTLGIKIFQNLSVEDAAWTISRASNYSDKPSLFQAQFFASFVCEKKVAIADGELGGHGACEERKV